MLVAERILKYPGTYEQGVWISNNGSKWTRGTPSGLCGTKACIAGHAILLERGRLAFRLVEADDYKERDARFVKVVRQFLGLTKEQANTLFVAWPEDWIYALNIGRAKGPIYQAKVGYDYIKYFIKKNGIL
jgi:hypothetical protein